MLSNPPLQQQQRAAFGMCVIGVCVLVWALHNHSHQAKRAFVSFPGERVRQGSR